MPKLGIGVGEEFPVDAPPPSDPLDQAKQRRRRRWRLAAHLLLKFAAIVVGVGLIGWTFRIFAGPFAWYGPNAYYAGWHHPFFFPFFPLLLVLVLIFAFRRHHHYGYHCGMRRWHDEMHREHGDWV